MKTLRSLLMALAFLMMLAVPAVAQEFSGTVEVDCFGDPETVTVSNTGTVPFVVDSVTSLNDPGDNEPFDVGVELEVGTSVLFETGAAADPALTTEFIFDNEAADEGVEVVINTEGQGDTVAVSCEERSGSFGGAPSPGPTPGKTPDNQQGGDMVTKTFELTLNGDVPEGQAFAVRYGQQQEGDVRVIVFCGDPAALADLPGYEALDECVGDGSVYGKSVELERGTTIFSTFERVSGDEEEFFFESNTGEVLDADMTNTAWYTFGKGTGAGDEQETPDNQQDGEDKDSGTGDDQELPDNQQEGEKPDTGAGEVPDNQQDGEDKDAGAGDEQETPDNQQDDVEDDQQGEMPDELPDTGAGGLAGGLPLGSAAAGLAMLAGAGYAVLRRP